MGKGLQKQDSNITPEHHPGCMWGILHNLNHSRWHQVRKHLPHMKHTGRKQVAGIGYINATAATDSGDIQERVEGKAENSPIVASKGSMLSRIRSLITEETSKRKARHRRSSSCPIHLEQPSLEILLNDKTLEHPYKNNNSVSSLLDPLPKKTLEELIYSREQTEKSSKQEPIEFQNMKSCSCFMKSDSFPSRGRRAVRSRNTKNKMECEYYAKGERVLFDSAEHSNGHLVTSTDLSSDDDVGKHVLKRLESLDNVSPSSPRAIKKHRETKLILNRFKNLREKIRHALKESRKERRRIIMDSVFHKVPHGNGSSRDVKNGGTSSPCSSPFSKSETKSFRRTSSVNESLDRYNRLLDFSDRSTFRASRSPSPARSSSSIGLERILSLPDLRYYPSFKLEDSPEPGFSYALSRAGSSNNLNIAITKSNEHIKSMDNPEYQTEPDYYSDSKSTIFLDVNESFDDFGGVKTDEISSSAENIIEATSSVNSKLDKPIPISPADMIIQNAEEDAVNVDMNRIHFPIQVDERYKGEFNYVKDVLELSGFSGNELLGKWHSAEQAVNPLVFEQLLDCCGDEERGICDDELLLFDLVNEVLLQIHERSCSYWPKSLTCRSYIHTMPVGYHVLEEVWRDINSCLESKLMIDQPIDDAVSRDLAKDEAWMNLQFDAVCVGLELEDVILDDLLEELIFE